MKKDHDTLIAWLVIFLMLIFVGGCSALVLVGMTA